MTEIGPADYYSEFSVTGSRILERDEMPELRDVSYVFFTDTPSLVDIRLPKWTGSEGECGYYLDFYGNTCPSNGEPVVIRLCSLETLVGFFDENGLLSFNDGDCYQVRGTDYAEALCEERAECTVYDGKPRSC